MQAWIRQKKGVQKSRSCFHRLPYKIKSIYRFPQWGIYRMDKVWRENGSYSSLDLLLCIFNIDEYSGRNQDVSVSQSHSIAFNLQGLSGAPWRSLITDKMRVN